MNDQKNPYDDEIDLREIFGVLIRRKTMIILVFLLSLVASAAISLMQPKTYQATAFVARPILGENLLSASRVIEHMTSDQNLANIMRKLDMKGSIGSFRNFVNVEEIRSSGSLKIQAKAHSPQAAQRITERLVKNYLDFTSQRYKARKDLYEEKLNTLKEHQARSQADVKTFEAMLQARASSQEVFSSDSVLKDIVLANVLSEHRPHLARLKDQEISIRLILSNAQEPAVLRRLDSKLVSPKIKQNIALAGLLGLFFGVVFAFVADFLGNNKPKTT